MHWVVPNNSPSVLPVLGACDLRVEIAGLQQPALALQQLARLLAHSFNVMLNIYFTRHKFALAFTCKFSCKRTEMCESHGIIRSTRDGTMYFVINLLSSVIPAVCRGQSLPAAPHGPGKPFN